MREGWKDVKFETLLEIPLRNGINRPSRLRGKGFKMVNMGELFANDRLQNIEMELVQLNASEQENFQIKNFDLLFARQSIVAEGAGKCSIVLGIDNINCFESHLIRARINDKNSALFYYYLFQSAYGKGLLSTIRQQGVQAGIRGSDLQKLKIICPPLETQRKIASILSGYDDLIENNLKRIKILEEMAQQTYEEWFVRMRFPGASAPLSIQENSATERSRSLPEGWEKKTLVDLGKVITGKTPSTSNEDFYNGNIPFIKTPDMNGSTYVIETNQYLTELGSDNQKGKLIDKNSLVVSCIGSAGAFALVSKPSQFNQQINAITFKKEEFTFFTYCYAKSLKEKLEALGSNGATMTNVNKTKFEKIEIILPDSQLLNKFHKIFKPNFENILNLQSQNQRLRETRDLLLPRLMMGILEV